MGSCESCGGGNSALVLHGANIAVLGKVLQQQKREGQAALSLIDSAAAVAKGAPEPGKGGMVDVVA